MRKSFFNDERGTVTLLIWSSSYKNFKCGTHNRFFEVNVYQKDAVNAHHWRHNIARPGSEIDL